MPLFTITLFCILSTTITTLPTTVVSDHIVGRNETDRLALLAFKSGIIQDPHRVLSSWNNSVHFCQWKGVQCGRRHKRVTKLFLRAKRLVGTLSPFVGNLSFLRELRLSNNSFSGPIPPQLGKLHRLQSLILVDNEFEGEIPANLSHCLGLTTLRLGRNRLVGNIPIELGHLSNLRFLGLDYNNLTGGLSSIANLTHLQILLLSGQGYQGTGFQRPIPDFIGKFKHLTVLSIGGSNFSGTIPQSIYNLSSLQILDLSENQLQGNLPPKFGLYFPQLRLFASRGNKFSGPIPISLSNLSKLEILDLSSNPFEGKFSFDGGNMPNLSELYASQANLGTGGGGDLYFLKTLVNCSHLDVLDIGYNSFQGTLPHSTANLSSTIRLLDFSNNLISGRIPTGLGNLLNLQYLYLNDNEFTGIIPADIGQMSRLQQAYLGNNKLTGNIPYSLGNLSWLSILKLKGNEFQGTIPASLGNCKSLLSLDLSQNNLAGNVPRQIFQPPSLNELDLHQNQLEGSLPSEISELQSLVYLDMSNNSLSGEIPSSLGQCVGLTYFSLAGNCFEGSIPLSFKPLRGLQALDLSHNHFSGHVPDYFSNFPTLASLNLSFNHLEGEVPTKGVFTNLSAISLVGNNKLCGGIPELRLPRCSTLAKSKENKLSHEALIIIISVSSVLGALAILFSLYLLYSRKRKKASSSPTSPPLKEPFLKASYDMLLKATDGFSPRNFIGGGGFGSVYKGTLAEDGVERVVAVKVINSQRRGASKSFMAECEALRIIRHRNLVKVITACSSVDHQGNDFKALVYDFMPNGSLKTWLHSGEVDDRFRNPLSLVHRVNIAIDVAHALDYIHSGCGTPIIHCDLKPTNVLLDDDMTAHVGDFGLAKLLTEFSEQLRNSSSIGVRGTIGYAAPEYGLGTAVSAAGDVYSYGIMLIEIMTAIRPTDLRFEAEMTLHKFAKMALPDRLMEILDPRLKVDGERSISQREIECAKLVVEIGVKCSSELPRDRMGFQDVISQLRSARDHLNVNRRRRG